MLRKGCMMTYVILGDAARQILRSHFPGDMLGLSSILYEEAPETICALSECVVCPFEMSGFSKLVETHPQLAALGRTSAKARVGSLLIGLRNRLRAADREIGGSFALGLTQEEIGDATGLTAVHVNRRLRQLEEEGMIARTGGRVTIRDQIALSSASNYVDRYEGLDLSWLPKGR